MYIYIYVYVYILLFIADYCLHLDKGFQVLPSKTRSSICYC